MKYEGKIVSPDIEEMKQHVQKKANLILSEFTEDSKNRFLKEASIIAESILEKYIFATYDFFVSGELSIKDLSQKESFTNPQTGYQQKMLEWKEQNKPEEHLYNASSLSPQKSSEKHWHYYTLGAGTAIAIGLAIYCYRKGLEEDRCYLVGTIVELLTLFISFCLFKKEKSEKHNKEQREQNESDLQQKRELFVNETIDSLENWLKQGDAYSNELLTTYNL